MLWPLKYLVALLPAAICLGGWQGAIWAFDFFECEGDIKHMHPCLVGTVNLLPLLGIGLFWLPILSVITVPVSVWMLITTGVKHFESHKDGPQG